MTPRNTVVVAVAAALLALTGALPAQALASTSRPAAAEVNITGQWTLHTTDCFFGQCTFHITIQQANDQLTGNDPSTGNLYGWIERQHFKFNVIGVSPEDDWSVSGYSGAAGLAASGNFSDGTGGSGTFRMSKTGP